MEKMDTAISEQEHALMAKTSTFSFEIQGETEQFDITKITASLNVKGKEIDSQESDTPTEENKEGMIPEDSVLLTYVLRQNRKECEIKLVDSSTKSEMKVTDKNVDYTGEKSQVDIQTFGDDHEIVENSQKSCGMK